MLGAPIQKRDDIVCQTKVHLSYRGYRIDIRDLRWIEGSGFAVSIQFKAKQKWHHGIFRDQNRALLDDLQSMCRSEIAGLSFSPFSTTVPGDPLMGEGSIRLSFFHDSRAFNQNWSEGRDISPLLLAPDSHHGNCFIEFQFNPAGYVRQGDKTVLRSDWLQNAFLISEGIESDAKRMLGMD